MSKKTGDSVRAVERALDILRAFTANDYELTAADLGRRVKLSRPTLYRLLYTLQNQGFITAEGDPQRFRLGPEVARLAHIWQASLDIARTAQPVLQKVWERTRETVALFVPQNEQRLCVAELPCLQPLNFRRGVGYTETILRGASGRAILAYMDTSDDELDAMAAAHKMDARAIRKQLDQVRERGYAESEDELLQGAIAVASPYFDGSGKIAGSIAIFGPAVRIDDARRQEMANLIVEAGRELSRLLGYTDHTAAREQAAAAQG